MCMGALGGDSFAPAERPSKTNERATHGQVGATVGGYPSATTRPPTKPTYCIPRCFSLTFSFALTVTFWHIACSVFAGAICRHAFQGQLDAIKSIPSYAREERRTIIPFDRSLSSLSLTAAWYPSTLLATAFLSAITVMYHIHHRLASGSSRASQKTDVALSPDHHPYLAVPLTGNETDFDTASMSRRQDMYVDLYRYVKSCIREAAQTDHFSEVNEDRFLFAISTTATNVHPDLFPEVAGQLLGTLRREGFNVTRCEIVNNIFCLRIDTKYGQQTAIASEDEIAVLAPT
ncbi:uncharacterized protein EV422DRAFT_503609 [Fimicolochytrium jonesii]|uniref:uncharacterized protein n=1 Tax=Fimicolochytrium jonesii TaxID=1396493 RepID=UPI0022FE15FE|nr:uncharacterized protein EV422DRAFT_503609 [Fimicolochytrium jonesii]KAI8824797.1 hypothetical protein EV422DRAFT_503609 [Fimicolochytrium jonesii]